jgi:hypothetical protein
MVTSSTDSILAKAGRVRPASSCLHGAVPVNGHARDANGISLDGPGAEVHPAAAIKSAIKTGGSRFIIAES